MQARTGLLVAVSFAKGDGGAAPARRSAAEARSALRSETPPFNLRGGRLITRHHSVPSERLCGPGTSGKQGTEVDLGFVSLGSSRVCQVHLPSGQIRRAIVEYDNEDGTAGFPASESLKPQFSCTERFPIVTPKHPRHLQTTDDDGFDAKRPWHVTRCIT